MILEFSDLKEEEEEKSKKEITNDQLRKQKHLEYYLKIKRNIIDFFFWFIMNYIQKGKLFQSPIVNQI